MVKFKFLCIFSILRNRRSCGKNQAGAVLRDHGYAIAENASLISHDGDDDDYNNDDECFLWYGL